MYLHTYVGTNVIFEAVIAVSLSPLEHFIPIFIAPDVNKSQ